jgi:hypothetical protein
VVAIRSPIEAAISMAQKYPRAQPLTHELSERMWLVHDHDIFRHCKGHVLLSSTKKPQLKQAAQRIAGLEEESPQDRQQYTGSTVTHSQVENQ